VTSPKRFALMLAAAAALTIASSLPGEAQITYPFPPYRYPNIHPDASLRLEVTPRDTEVYVDGYYAGVVDDFDGMLQRLRVEPGQHEVTLYHEGYRAAHQRVYLARDRTFKIRQQLEKLADGEVGEPRPIPAPVPAGAPPPRPLPRDGRGTPPNQPPPNARPGGNSPTTEQTATGRLTIQVQPADANVLIDGQPWPASPGQDTVILDLSEGRHVVQARKPGYVGYLTEVEVRRGETATVNVTLRTQP
jgi:PEGA domain